MIKRVILGGRPQTVSDKLRNKASWAQPEHYTIEKPREVLGELPGGILAEMTGEVCNLRLVVSF